MLLGEADGYQVVDDSLGLVSGAVAYVDEVAREAGDIQRVQEVLEFLKKEAVILVKYSGEKLTTCLESLSQSSVRM
jgi:hypothetical protein